MDIDMEAEWKQLEEQCLDWHNQLTEAEKCGKQVEDWLAQAHDKLTQLETVNREWDLPPSLDTADAERDEVQSTISSLNSIEELVLCAKMETDSKPYIDVTERLAEIEQRLTSLKESAVVRR